MKNSKRLQNTLSSRQQQLKRRALLKRSFALSLFSALLVLVLSFGCFGMWSQAQNKQNTSLYKYYTNVEVQYGDSLWDIASRYCDSSYEDYDTYIREVMLINRMLEPNITAGSYLIVPYHSAEFIQ
ncbi:MAG: LysM peptidoglycan-binding domain-containing protein [Lachnospiraceae bacterium]|nr:LysM peptidoglycan-binding domain-containing protein [Lachnospiraceae bacterium]MDD7027127.1 LysM peptidoglycan-binding domain-containing protein [Lachnospiraceae bacterium]MDY5700162.1 LysM peptidoglycan-binding domain-containing protein [Lachnospiraceae bacterium]